MIIRNLEDHYRSAHQICEDPVCLAKRYVVFSNGIDLAAHSLAHHPFMQVDACNMTYVTVRSLNLIYLHL